MAKSQLEGSITISRQAIFWVATLIACVLFLWIFRSILLPFVAGAALAYLLDPVADRLEGLGFSRLWATMSILVGFTLLFALGLIIIIPLLLTQLANFVDYLPGAVTSLRDLVVNSENALIKRIVGQSQTALGDVSPDLLGELTTFVTSFLRGLLSSGAAIVDAITSRGHTGCGLLPAF